jgi:hypothetical protein
MDILIYFLDNPPDILSLIVLFGVYLLFEILGEIIAEFFARPVFDKFKPDQRIKKLEVYYESPAKVTKLEGNDMKIEVKKGHLSIRDGRNRLFAAAPGQWASWKRIE